jgi:hypothetical protein
MPAGETGTQAFPESKAAILLDFTVHLELPCSSPAVHCHRYTNTRECVALRRSFRCKGLKLGDLERR